LLQDVKDVFFVLNDTEWMLSIRIANFAVGAVFC